jgi:hypothetical protein
MTKQDVTDYARKMVGEQFAAFLELQLEWECKLDARGQIVAEDVPGDHGSLTYAGVDKTAHPFFPFHNPRPADVVNAYLQDWRNAQAVHLPAPVGAVIANYCVNCGPQRAAKLLQAALNRLGAEPALKVDGNLGPVTLAAAQGHADPRNLAAAVILEGEDFYRRIGTGRMAKFLKGWLRRNRAVGAWCLSREAAKPEGALA